MNAPAALFALAVMSLGASVAAPASAQPTVVVSPQPLPIDSARPSVFLGGSIDMAARPTGRRP